MRHLLVATGFRGTYAPFSAALLVVVGFPEGTVDRIGPFPLQPELRVLVVVPILCALATSISHLMSGSRVIRQVPRVHLLRLISLTCAAVVSGALVSMASCLGGSEVVGGLLRNYLWLAGVAMATSVSVGAAYAWFPLVAIFGLAIVLPSDASDWSLYGLLLREGATGPQLFLASLVFVANAALYVANPRCLGYLRMGRDGRDGAESGMWRTFRSRRGRGYRAG